MKVAELFNEGWFNKKESKNEPLTSAERKMIASAFKGHNADIKKPGTDDPLFPENIHVVTDTKRITFYKRDGQLKATVGHHRHGEAGDPKKRPISHTDHDINSVDDLKSLQEDRVDEISLDTTKSYLAKRYPQFRSLGQSIENDIATRSNDEDTPELSAKRKRLEVMRKNLRKAGNRVSIAASREEHKKREARGENIYGYGSGRYQGD